MAAELKRYLETNFADVCASFQSTTRFGKVKSIKAIVAGRKVYIRFKCTTGDAMGMNMISKGMPQPLLCCSALLFSSVVCCVSK